MSDTDTIENDTFEAEVTDPTPDTFADATPSTRPAAAPRRGRRGERRKVTRYTLDLETEQHKFLRLFAIQHEVEASKVCRILLYLLETDPSLQERVNGELWDTDPE